MSVSLSVISQFLNSDDVYAAIIKEREYQDERWGTNGLPAQHELESFLVYIESYVDEAKTLLARNSKEDVIVQVQHNLRKIAALAVAAMEQHGVALRENAPPRSFNDAAVIATISDGNRHD